MKDFLRRGVVVAFVGLLIPACGGKGGGGGGGTPPPPAPPPPGVNQAPGVALSSPSQGSSFSAGSPVALEAQVTDADGWVARVDFFDGPTLLGADSAWPFRFDWSGAAQGTHSLSAVAVDNLGAVTTSASVLVSVTASGGPPPPPPPPPPPNDPPTGILHGVFFADVDHGWTVGEEGIWATLDGGVTWTRQRSGVFLSRVQFVSTTVGWAVGEAGTILSSANGGATWTARPSGTTAFLNGLSFVNSTTGWVVGAEGTIRKTTDGGATWTPQDGGTTESLGAVSFVSPLRGWIGGFGVILSTVDGGATWTSQSTEFTAQSGFPATGYIIDARFMSDTRGTMVGNARTGDILWTTSDGGLTWDRNNTSPPPYAMIGVAFGSAGFLCAVGTWGNIATSSDGGFTWTLQPAVTPQTLRGVWFVSGTTGWAVGDGATVLRTTDAGATWAVLNGGT